MENTITMEQMTDLFRKSADEAVTAALARKSAENAAVATDILHILRNGANAGDAKPVKVERVLGRLTRALINRRFDPDGAMRDIKGGKYGNDVPMIEAVERAMSAGDAAGGGFWLSPEMSTEIIDSLSSKAVVRMTGPGKVNLDSGVMNMGKITEDSSAHYVGENRPAPASAVGAGNVTLTARKIMAKVPLSNDLLLYGNDAADLIVRRNIVRSMRVREDRAFLRGMQSEYSPRGLRYWAHADNITESNGATLADIRQDLLELIGGLEDRDVPMENCWFFMSPRTKNHLMWNAADGNGNLVFAKELAAGKLANYPVAVTTSIPTNLGDGAESEIIFADMSDVIIGDASQIMLTSSDTASYDDEDGNMQSAFDNDQTVIRAIGRHDMIARRSEAIAVKTVVEWGAPA